jgi:hypothetical protein
MKEIKYEPIPTYNKYVEFIRKLPLVRMKEIKYCHQVEFFTAMTEGRSVKWTIGLYSNMNLKNDNMRVFFGLV